MKNLLIGLILGALFVMGISRVTATNLELIAEVPWGSGIYKVSDGNTKCYLARGVGSNVLSISCVRVK